MERKIQIKSTNRKVRKRKACKSPRMSQYVLSQLPEGAVVDFIFMRTSITMERKKQ